MELDKILVTINTLEDIANDIKNVIETDIPTGVEKILLNKLNDVDNKIFDIKFIEIEISETLKDLLQKSEEFIENYYK